MQNKEIAIPRTVRLELCCRSFAKNERSSICREALRYNYPESVISKFPWRKIAKVRWGQEMEDKFQGCSALSQGKIRNDKSCFRRLQWLSALFQRKSALKQHWFRADFFVLNFWFFSAVSEKTSAVQLCFRENQRWNSSDSALIFLLWKFPVSELFQRKSALFSSESALFQRKSALFQRWFLALKICVFSAVLSWISAVQRFSGNEQRWNRPESILNQSWSALNVSETSTRELFEISKLFQ